MSPNRPTKNQNITRNSRLAFQALDAMPSRIMRFVLIHGRQRREAKQRLADSPPVLNYDLQEAQDRQFELTRIVGFCGVRYVEAFHHHKPARKYKTRGGHL